MYYIIIVFLTFLQTLWALGSMNFPVEVLSPAMVRVCCNYILPPMLLFCPLLFTRRRRWTYVVSLLMDVWFIGNLIYFRSYGDVLSRWCLDSAGNMNGLWSSVIPFVHASDIVILLITAVWIIISELTALPHLFAQLRWRTAVTVGFAAMLCIPQAITARQTETPVCPFATFYDDVSMGRLWYTYTYGPLTHFCNETVNYLRDHETPPEPLTDDELAPYLQTPDSTLTPCGNILFVLFESLEDWTIGLRVGGEEVTPCLNRLAAHPHTGTYPMTAQVRQGKSSDARLICLNGLLPIYNGATAMRYASNTYPSWVTAMPARTKQCFTASQRHIWNQERNTYAYGFDYLFAEAVSDAVLVDSVLHAVRTAQRPFVLATYTMASHAPFIDYADSAALPVDNAFDDEKRRYLNCVHYTDSVLGILIDEVLNDRELADNTRIIILGDHPVFDMDTPVPFIFYDPFETPAAVSRTLYQMDIYTTVTDRLHLPTAWHGLGRNIADTCACTQQQLRDLEVLSDRLIRTDYFSKQHN